MAALNTLVFVFIVVTFLREGFGVSDEEFQSMSNMIGRLTERIGDLTQEVGELRDGLEKEIKRNKEMENNQDQKIRRLSAVVSRHEDACKSSNMKRNPEVLEHGLVQNNTIEERVSLLEEQIVDLQEDIIVFQADVMDLDEDVDFLFDEQIIQDERLLGLEQTSVEVIVELAEVNANILDLDNRVVVLEANGGGDGNSSVSELEVRVEAVEGTVADHETRISTAETDIEALETKISDLEVQLSAAEENIQGLRATDLNHDARISALEENGGSGSQNDTIAFHSVLTSYSTIPFDSTVMYNTIILNEGDGYDNGVFTVPLDGDGIYYFSIYVFVNYGEWGLLDIRLNGDVICTANADHRELNDFPAASCSAVVDVVAGDIIQVVYVTGTDDTPFFANSSYLYNGFNGFRI